jgi:hypothetical protein
VTDAIAAIISAVIAGIVAVAVSLLAARSQVKELKKRFEYEQLAERQRDREKNGSSTSIHLLSRRPTSLPRLSIFGTS